MFKLNTLLCSITLLYFVFTGVSAAQQPQYSNSGIQLPPLQGNVEENQYNGGKSYSNEGTSGFVKDALNGQPIPDAKVEIPDKGLSTTTRADGSFKLDLDNAKGDFILSVKKDGYLPFALNLKKDAFNNPFTLFVEKKAGQLVIDNNIHHLGDNSFSQQSANAGAFRMPSEGMVFMKDFYLESYPKKGMVLKIGSIIGLDTIASREAGQSNLTSFSTPLSIYINSVKIAEIALNSSNKIIPIPNTVLKPKSQNLLILQTGVNQALKLTNKIDYDDIEFMNLILQER